MPKIKVVFDRQNCIGAQACTAACPKYWKIAEDGKANLAGSQLNSQTGKHELTAEVNEEDLVCLKESTAACPVRVIILEQ